MQTFCFLSLLSSCSSFRDSTYADNEVSAAIGGQDDASSVAEINGM